MKCPFLEGTVINTALLCFYVHKNSVRKCDTIRNRRANIFLLGANVFIHYMAFVYCPFLRMLLSLSELPIFIAM
jgi:hypothetical protein